MHCGWEYAHVWQNTRCTLDCVWQHANEWQRPALAGRLSWACAQLTGPAGVVAAAAAAHVAVAAAAADAVAAAAADAAVAAVVEMQHQEKPSPACQASL